MTKQGYIGDCVQSEIDFMPVLSNSTLASKGGLLLPPGNTLNLGL